MYNMYTVRESDRRSKLFLLVTSLILIESFHGEYQFFFFVDEENWVNFDDWINMKEVMVI